MWFLTVGTGYLWLSCLLMYPYSTGLPCPVLMWQCLPGLIVVFMVCMVDICARPVVYWWEVEGVDLLKLGCAWGGWCGGCRGGEARETSLNLIYERRIKNTEKEGTLCLGCKINNSFIILENFLFLNLITITLWETTQLCFPVIAKIDLYLIGTLL